MGAIASAIFRIRVRNMSVLIIMFVSMCHSGLILSGWSEDRCGIVQQWCCAVICGCLCLVTCVCMLRCVSSYRVEKSLYVFFFRLQFQFTFEARMDRVCVICLSPCGSDSACVFERSSG